ncbi:MAG: hypothetical protein ACJ0P8_01215 [Flavobacteriales bacterium]
MKNYILLILSIFLFGCSSEVTKVTWDDPKSIALNKHIENYVNKDFDAVKELFSENLKISVSGQEENI